MNKIIDIGTDQTYPAVELSNFAHHPFMIDGVLCNSMEGFLQSLKFENFLDRKEVCLLYDKYAKFAGKKKKWWKTQTLYWQDRAMQRESVEYYSFIYSAYIELTKQNTYFRVALIDTKYAELIHSIGKLDPKRTVLTSTEFCNILTWIRIRLKLEYYYYL